MILERRALDKRLSRPARVGFAVFAIIAALGGKGVGPGADVGWRGVGQGPEVQHWIGRGPPTEVFALLIILVPSVFGLGVGAAGKGCEQGGAGEQRGDEALGRHGNQVVSAEGAVTYSGGTGLPPGVITARKGGATPLVRLPRGSYTARPCAGP